MKKMVEIAIVDDKEENLEAARYGIKSVLEHANIRTFSSASEIIMEIMLLNYRPSLVLTDLEMGQDKEAGFKVNMASWGNKIPAVVVTQRDNGGNHGATTSISMNGARFNQSKEHPDTWSMIINHIIDDYVYATHYALTGFVKWDPEQDKFSNETALTFDAFARLFLK